MNTLILLVHIVICLILIIAVLLQSGKAADLAGAFGGAGSQTAFGPRGTATLLSKVTTICAVLFMVTSVGLWILSLKGEKSVVRGEEPAKQAATTTTTDVKKEAQAPATAPASAPATEKKEDAQQQQKQPPAQTETPKKEPPKNPDK